MLQLTVYRALKCICINFVYTYMCIYVSMYVQNIEHRTDSKIPGIILSPLTLYSRVSSIFIEDILEFFSYKSFDSYIV